MKTLRQHILEEKQMIKETRKRIRRYKKEIEIYQKLIAQGEYDIKFSQELIKKWEKKFNLDDIYENDEGEIQ